jgi:hypothetical protein
VDLGCPRNLELVLQLRVVLRLHASLLSGCLIAHIHRALDLEYGWAVKAQAVERCTHPFQVVGHQAKRLHYYSQLEDSHEDGTFLRWFSYGPEDGLVCSF